MLSFASPLFVTAMAPWLLREHVGARRWAAVVAGFGGVAIIVSPSAGDVSYFGLLPLGAALCGALRDMLTRRIADHETTESMVFYSSAGVLLAGLLATRNDITLVAVYDWRLIAIASLTNVTALYLMVEAVRNAQAATVAPFKYCNLLWVTLFGLGIWAQFPRWNVLLGAGVIVAAMLYILHGARGFQRAAAQAALDGAVAVPPAPNGRS
jgi:drug/metabolite transporter (DMT)-like permease